MPEPYSPRLAQRQQVPLVPEPYSPRLAQMQHVSPVPERPVPLKLAVWRLALKQQEPPMQVPRMPERPVPDQQVVYWQVRRSADAPGQQQARRLAPPDLLPSPWKESWSWSCPRAGGSSQREHCCP